jgi:hypothetical protein
MPLTPYSAGDTFNSNTINQFVNILLEPSGGQETGHYEIEGPVYTASGSFLSGPIVTLSRVSVPVSASVDSSDDSGAKLNAPTTGHLTAGAMQIYAATNSTGTTGHVGGVYTCQY